MLGAGALAEVDLELDDFDFAIKHGMLMVGSPDDVAEKIADYQAGINLNHFQQFPSIPHLDFKQAMTSLELLGTRVMPQINH